MVLRHPPGLGQGSSRICGDADDRLSGWDANR